MSSGSVGFNKSLNGNNIGEFDSIDLTQWTGALTIEGASGTAGQVLKKNATTNKIEWGSDTPGSLSATSPIVLTGTNLALGTNFGGQAITTTGTITAGTVAATTNLTVGGVDVCKAASNPLALSSGTMSLNFNTNDFQLDGSNNLELKNDPVITASLPLGITTGNISLNFNTNDFQLDASNNLELKDTFFKTATNPLFSAGDSVGLNFNTGDFQLDGSNHLALKNDPVITASNPLSVSTGNITLNFNTNDFQLDGSNNLELKNDPVLTASDPLSISTGNISLTLDSSKLEVSSGELTLKEDYVKTASNPLTVSTGNISLNFETTNLETSASNKLDIKSDLTSIDSITAGTSGIEIKKGSTTYIQIDSNGNLLMPNLPTSDPGVTNEIYVQSGYLRRSFGGPPP